MADEDWATWAMQEGGWQSNSAPSKPRANYHPARRSRFFPLLGRAAGGGEIAGRVDKSDMREGLGKVADLTLLPGIEFLGQQANIVRQSEKPLEIPACF